MSKPMRAVLAAGTFFLLLTSLGNAAPAPATTPRAAPAAGAPDLWAPCKAEDPNLAVKGCTNIIQTATFKPDEKALAHYIRAINLQRMGRGQMAYDDYTAAVTLKPNFAEAFSDRGLL